MIYKCASCQAKLDTSNPALLNGVCPECGSKFPGKYAGQTVRDFQVIGELARGANGVVYVARQVLLERDVALKLMLQEVLGEAENIQHFFEESQAAAKVTHPNIVQAYASGVDENGVCYFAMELIEGITLESHLDNFGALEFTEALHIGSCLADALSSAWRQVHLVHGDIKPANVLIGKNGEPKLADLGQAHFGMEKPKIDSLMATPLYVPPELVRGEYDKIGALTDIYSFGAMLYELFAGEPPFFSLDMDTVLNMQLHDRPQPLKERLGFFNQSLSDFIDRMLAKNPDVRPANWGEVSDFLHKIELRFRLNS